MIALLLFVVAKGSTADAGAAACRSGIQQWFE